MPSIIKGFNYRLDWTKASSIDDINTKSRGLWIKADEIIETLFKNQKSLEAAITTVLASVPDVVVSTIGATSRPMPFDGQDGEDGMPGPVGPQGPRGLVGAPGHGIPGFDGNDGEDLIGPIIAIPQGIVYLPGGITGTLDVGHGGTGTATAFTQGSVIFAGASGVYNQNNANFFWDNTNIRLSIGAGVTPATALHVAPATDSVVHGIRVDRSLASNAFTVLSAASGVSNLTAGDSADYGYLNFYQYKSSTSSSRQMAQFDNLGQLGIGTAFTPSETLSIKGITSRALLGVLTNGGAYKFYIDVNGRIGTNGITSPTAQLHLGAGAAAANGAPLMFTSGPVLAAPVAGAFEFLTDTLSITTTTGPTRRLIPLNVGNVAFAAGSIIFAVASGYLSQNNNKFFWDNTNESLGIGTNSPTGRLHLPSGAATASLAPLKFTSGTSLTTAEAGAMEFTTDDFFLTITTGAARKGIVLDNGSRLASGKVPVATTNGRLIDSTAALLAAALIPSVVGSTFEKAETGTDANVLTYTTNASTDEFLVVQVATDVSALTGTSIAITVTWKDSNNATATSTLTLSATGDGTINIPINAFKNTNVVVSTVFVGVSTNYIISAFIARLK